MTTAAPCSLHPMETQPCAICTTGIRAAPAPDFASTDPIDDLCARLRANPWRDIFGEAADALQRLRAERDEAWASAQAYKLDLALATLSNKPCGPISYASWEEYRQANPARDDWYAAVAVHSKSHINQLAAERDTLAAIVRAADAMLVPGTDNERVRAYAAARAKWEGK